MTGEHRIGKIVETVTAILASILLTIWLGLLVAALDDLVGRSRYAAEEISTWCITPSVAQFRAPLKQREVYYGSGRSESI
jgi:hypothetical protein